MRRARAGGAPPAHTHLRAAAVHQASVTHSRLIHVSHPRWCAQASRKGINRCSGTHTGPRQIIMAAAAVAVAGAAGGVQLLVEVVRGRATRHESKSTGGSRCFTSRSKARACARTPTLSLKSGCVCRRCARRQGARPSPPSPPPQPQSLPLRRPRGTPPHRCTWLRGWVGGGHEPAPWRRPVPARLACARVRVQGRAGRQGGRDTGGGAGGLAALAQGTRRPDPSCPPRRWSGALHAGGAACARAPSDQAGHHLSPVAGARST